MNKLLREGVISKLRGYNAYVDNELPDYIMVMLANKKNTAQIGQDLQLFLGNNTERFTGWLETVVSDPSMLQKDRVRGEGREEGGGEERQREGGEEEGHREGGGEEGLCEGGGEGHQVREEGPGGGGGEKINSSAGGEDKRVSGGGGGRDGRRLKLSAGEVEKNRGGGGNHDHGGPTRSHERVPPTSQQSRTRKRSKMESYSDEERRPPSPKFSRMRSDRYEYEREKEEAARFHRDRAPRRPLEEPQRSIQPQRLRVSLKKTVRAQPDSTRDQDLRELIGGRRHSEARSYLRRREVARGRGGKVESEEEEDNDDESVPTTTIASVVRLVESSKPRRTNEGGSRLLHKAILGLRPKMGENTPTFNRGGLSRRDKLILLPASMLGDRPPKNIVLTKQTLQESAVHEVSRQHISSTHIEEEEEVDLEKEEEEEVVVELDGGLVREYDEEEEDEYRIEDMRPEEGFEKEEQKMEEDILPPPIAEAGVVKAIVSAQSSSGTSSAGREWDTDREMDLRALITRSRASRGEGQSTRFVVTLSGMDTAALPPCWSVEAPGESLGTTPEVTVVAKRSAKERLGTKTVPVEALKVKEVPVEEETVRGENGGTGLSDLPEKCRFWPNCKNGSKCPYHHPSIPCKLFPDCKFGKNCLFLHPKCKYDSRCTRINCSYLHTTPRHLAVKTQPIAPQILPAPIPFRPPPVFSSSYGYGGVNPSPRSWSSRYPSKSALSWKPSSHISERKFAVEEASFNLPT